MGIINTIYIKKYFQGKEIQMKCFEKYRFFVQNQGIPVTVFVITYNRCETLKKTINSVIKQSMKNIAIVILDNASTDNTKKIVSEFTDNRVFYYCQKENVGGIGNINTAISLAESPFFIIFHDDDVMCEKLVEEEYMTICENEMDAVSSRALLLDVNGKEICKTNNFNKNLFFTGNQYMEHVLRGGESAIFPTVIYRTKFIRNNQLFVDPKAGPCCDYFFLSEICMKNGKLMIMDKKLIERVCHSGQDSIRSEFWMNIQVLNYFASDSRYTKTINQYGSYFLKAYKRYIPHLLANYSEKKVEKNVVDTVLDGINLDLFQECLDKKIVKSLLVLYRHFENFSGRMFSIIRYCLRKGKQLEGMASERK